MSRAASTVASMIWPKPRVVVATSGLCKRRLMAGSIHQQEQDRQQYKSEHEPGLPSSDEGEWHQDHIEGRLYESHIPLTRLQKVLLAAGSSISAIIDPHRHDLVADFGETTGHQALRWMHSKMLASQEGSRVLADKPRLKSHIVDYAKLAELSQNTFGYRYSRFYTDNNVSPDTRKEVQFVDDAELAYVMQRYRELHDIVHTILEQPTTIRGEVIVKAFEGVQTRLPLCILGGLVGPLRLSHQERLDYMRRDLPWAIRCGREASFLMSVYFEDRFEQDIDELRRELNIRLQ